MRAVLELVTRSKVAVEGDVIGEFGAGLVVLLGVGANDTEVEVEQMTNKIANLWIFVDGEGEFNFSIALQTLRRHVNRLRNATKMAEPRIAQMIGNPLPSMLTWNISGKPSQPATSVPNIAPMKPSAIEAKHPPCS
jgi:hypothetical protein